MGNLQAAESIISNAIEGSETYSYAIVRCVPKSPEKEAIAIEDKCILHLDIGFLDEKVSEDPEIIEIYLNKFDQAYRFIEKARHNNIPVLVHCSAGASRSAAVVIAYLMRKEKMTMADVTKELRHIRPIVENINFKSCLEALEQKLNQHDERMEVGEDELLIPALDKDTESSDTCCCFSGW